ncbi:MAG: glycosyltransferase family 4 protein [Methylococcales bacterium]
MSVLFIHPPLQTEVSGGNIFNQHIIHQALAIGYPLVSFPITELQPVGELRSKIARLRPRLVIWDSLFYDFIVEHSLTSPAINHAMLVHYLPSLNPSLDPVNATKRRRSESKAIYSCERLICTGATIFRILSKLHPGKPVFLCRPGVDEFFRSVEAKKNREVKPENINLISVANLLPGKGYFELLEALAKLQAQPWIWHIAGSDRVDRSFSELFRSSALAMNLIDRIRFHGVLNQERLANLLSEMDLFVQASRYESYGMAVAEAVAAGLSVVSTRTGAATELILDKHNGFLVPVADPCALQNALKDLIGNPELRNRFRLNSRVRSRVSWTSCFENFKQACDFKL